MNYRTRKLEPSLAALSYANYDALDVLEGSKSRSHD